MIVHYLSETALIRNSYSKVSAHSLLCMALSGADSEVSTYCKIHRENERLLE